jgi:dTDP-glucose 4,6-dehydratase
VKIINCDLATLWLSSMANELNDVDYVWNLASESHVDRSITDPAPFIRNNIDLVINLLEWARRKEKPIRQFIQFSTDEVYGPAPGGMSHKEWSSHKPSNPYSASKAAQEDIAFSYWRTYGVPVIITNTMNVFGERQDPEKFIPLCILRSLRGENIPVHSDKSGRSGSRFYIHARNVASALLYISACHVDPTISAFSSDNPLPPRYNIVGEVEMPNDTLAETIIAEVAFITSNSATRTSRVEHVDFHSSRPGHDLRYALDGSALTMLGWTIPKSFFNSLRRTIRWTIDNMNWKNRG